MLVEAVGTPVAVSALQPGQCFFFGRDGIAAFAILSTDGQGHNAAAVFSHEEGERTPWIAIGGLPSTVLLVDGAIIRPNLSSLTFGEASLPLGAITNAGGSFYMSAALRRIETVTINLQTGMMERPPQTGASVHFPSWSVGIFHRDEWLCIFEVETI